MARTIRVYLDMCALKRPWDDQMQRRVADETLDVAALHGLARDGRVALLYSLAHASENDTDPEPLRAAPVARWLAEAGLPDRTPARVERRAREIARQGITLPDALHLAWAGELETDLFVTTDDRLRKKARQIRPSIGMRVMTPRGAVDEVIRWRAN